MAFESLFKCHPAARQPSGLIKQKKKTKMCCCFLRFKEKKNKAIEKSISKAFSKFFVLQFQARNAWPSSYEFTLTLEERLRMTFESSTENLTQNSYFC